MYDNTNNYLAQQAHRKRYEEIAARERLIREARLANPQPSAFSKVTNWLSNSIKAISKRSAEKQTNTANAKKPTRTIHV